jgi:hypothetical protein
MSWVKKSKKMSWVKNLKAKISVCNSRVNSRQKEAALTICASNLETCLPVARWIDGRRPSPSQVSRERKKSKN